MIYPLNPHLVTQKTLSFQFRTPNYHTCAQNNGVLANANTQKLRRSETFLNFTIRKQQNHIGQQQ